MNKRLIWILALLAITPTVVAQEAGSVLFAVGDVTAERQPPEALAKGDAILPADTVVTGAASRAQLLMIDSARIAIRPNSRLRIDDYSYTPPAAATVSTNDDRSAMNLIKGGFRTITGAIGQEADDEYEVRTAVGVLGIRGTDYTAVYCNGDCNPPVPDGLYLGVAAGTIVFTTATETIVLNAGEYAFIPLRVPEPQRLSEPPAILLDDNDFRFDGGDFAGKPGADDQRPDDGSGGDGSQPGSSAPGAPNTSGFNMSIGTRRAAPPSSAPGDDEESDDPAGTNTTDPARQPTIGTDADGNPVDITPGEPPQPTDPRSIAFSGGPFSPLDLGQNGVQTNAPNQYQLDAFNNVLGFRSPVAGARQGGPIDFEIGSAANVETGFDSMTIMRWGRWSGGSINIIDGTFGFGTPFSLANQSVHWVSGPIGAPPTIPILGVANYQLIGSTSPTDEQGNVGVLGNAAFQADFTNMLVNSTLDLTIGGINWMATGNGTIGAQAGLADHMFAGFYNNVIIGSMTGGSGTFSGFFSGPGPTSDPTFPGAAGLLYTLQDPQGAITVSGSAVFGNP